MTTSSEAVASIAELQPGLAIAGKWRGKQYRIERELGRGSNGSVYRVRHGSRVLALKLGRQTLDAQMEVNGLRQLQADGALEPGFLVDVDDWIAPDGREAPFYVMPYIEGSSAMAYVQERGREWFPIVAGGLLTRLAKLHRHGWVFGDLKADNVRVSGYGAVELVDYGGATRMGHPIKQFTELYDRGYWNAGPRTADAGYDLFAFAVLCLQLAGHIREVDRLSRDLPQNRSSRDLAALARQSSVCKPYAAHLAAMLQGEYGDAEAALAVWKRITRTVRRPYGHAEGRWIRYGLASSAAALAAAAAWYWN